jgi:predicted SprT family Zn-dependent metalloprotease
MQQAMQQVRDRCAEMVVKARELYGLDLSKVRVSFDLRGSAAGKAMGRAGQFTVKFNHDMLTREAFDHVYNDTIPHEYAHIICFMKRELGRNHDNGWRRVCVAMGGNGTRCHKEDVVYGKGTTYEYTTDRGHTVRVSDKHHRVIQSGRSLTWRKGLGTVTNACAYSIVGMQGRTLAAPIVRKPAATPAPNAPAVIEQFRRAPPPPLALLVQLPTPVQRVQAPAAPVFAAGQSKAAISRAIMLSGHRQGQSYEQIIAAMMLANGYDRQLARATYKANAAKVGVPQE